MAGVIGAGLLLMPPSAAYAEKANDLLIVDCLLPGRIQRLGTGTTYLAARKAIRTSAADCRLRGGEYTESGKTTYASLLRIWLPLAQAGNPEAQTNLGEIFERGAGGPPQPDLALRWYQLASDQGYARAQVNLGSLYERGIGVQRDAAKAMEWYRRAAGLQSPLSSREDPTDPAVQRRPAPTASPVQSKSQNVPDANFGHFQALIIGNNSYVYGPKLRNAAADANSVADILSRRYGFKTTVLIDVDRYAILTALNELRETLTPQDNLLIYYAGHGTIDEVNNRGYWLPVDAELSSNANWIASYQITDLINTMTARRIILIADSCFSGMMTQSAIVRLNSEVGDRGVGRGAQGAKHARVVFTSGGVQPVLDIGGSGHSVFAAALLRALEANTGVLGAQKLAQEVSRQVAASPAAAKISQVPVYAPLGLAGHEAGDFFFVPKS